MISCEVFRGRVAEILDSGQEQVIEAFDLATKLHSDQLRKDGSAYIDHIIYVANLILVGWGVTDTDTLIAALLHDSLEDQTKKLAQMYEREENLDEKEMAERVLEAMFGKTVVLIIKKLSNPTSYAEAVSLNEKNKLYVDHVSSVIEDPRVFLVKLADFYDNGMKLGGIFDAETRLRLSKKYLPLFSVFIDRLAENSSPLTVEIAGKVLSELESQRMQVQNYIDSH